MNSLSDKPGVLGVVGSIGNAVKQGATNEVKQTVQNTLEQLDLSGNKENKEKLVETAPQGPTPEQLRQQSQETVNWLYGTSSPEPTPPFVAEPKPEGKANQQQHLGIELKNPNTANVAQQFGVDTLTGAGQTTANTLEQLGMGKSNTTTLSAVDQLNVMPGPTLTPEQQQKQQQIKQQLHGAYYQRLINPQPQQSDSEERIKEKQEEQESAQQRMERLEQEDLQKKQQEAEKKKPVAAVDQAQNMEKHRGSMG